MGKECCKTPCHVHVKRVTTRVFRQYGELVGRHPLPFIILPIIVFGALGAGILRLEVEDDTEKLYFPKDSRAFTERNKVLQTFPDRNKDIYNTFAQNVYEEAGMFLFQPRNATDSIFSQNVATEILTILGIVTSFNVNGVTYEEFCAKFDGRCVVSGAEYVTPHFRSLVAIGNVTYPVWVDPSTGEKRDLSTDVADVTTLTGGVLKDARVLKTEFRLARSLPHSVQWQYMFLKYAIDHMQTNYTNVSYKMLYSLGDELDKATKGDLFLFGLAILLVVIYASLVTAGGDAVSTRCVLAFAGVLAAALGILASVGLLSLCGFKFSNIVGIMPYLIIGIGVDDMFLVMSSWSELTNDHVMTVPQRVGSTLALAGVGITVTSVTDLLAFLIGGSSVFYCVQSFCLYTGLAVLFCYVSNVTLFVGCLAIHGRRVYSSRHFLTCSVTKPRDQLVREGRSRIYAFCFGGKIPKGKRDDESIFEKLPRRMLPKFIVNPTVRIIILFGFAILLLISLYGVVNLKQGLQPQNLVSTKSYLHDYISKKEYFFPDRLSISFVMEGNVDYSSVETQSQMRSLLSSASRDQAMEGEFVRCWLLSYLNSSFYLPTNFTGGLSGFLQANITFQTDVQFDMTGHNIIASRCYVTSVPMREQYDQAALMTRMRTIADASPLPVFAFHYSFVTFEQYLATLPATLTTVGFAVLAMVVVCLVLLPHPLMVALVTLNILMILCGIFGFMYFWDITLSSVTMILLIMSVGFSVDFSAHVCSAYLMSNSITRSARAQDAIKHAASPIFNGGISSLVGIILLLASDTYIFTTFFKIMFLVILFGVLNAVLFMPVVLSLIGPENKFSKEDDLVAYCSKENQFNSCIVVNGSVPHEEHKEPVVDEEVKPLKYSVNNETDCPLKTDGADKPDSAPHKNGFILNGFVTPQNHVVLNGHVPLMNGLLPVQSGLYEQSAASSDRHAVRDFDDLDFLMSQQTHDLSLNSSDHEHGDASTVQTDTSSIVRLPVPDSFNRCQ